jgi:hypothetical protein
MYAMPDRDHMGMLHLDADAECRGATDHGHGATAHGQRAQERSRWAADEVAPGTCRGQSAGASAAKVPR